MKLIIHKEEIEFPYMVVAQAMRTLSGDAFKLYTYLSSFGDGEEVEVSPSVLAAEIGCSRTNIYRAID